MTDEELMMAVVAGDQSAYQSLVEKHLAPVSHYVFRILGSSKETEDIAQETFLRLWTRAEKWRSDKASLSTWLHRIAHNLCIDYHRKDRSEVSNELEQFEDSRHHLEQQLEIDDRLARLENAMLELPERQRNAIVLCHYQGFSNRDAANIMGISVEALESLMARGRRVLRAQLETKITH